MDQINPNQTIYMLSVFYFPQMDFLDGFIGHINNHTNIVPKRQLINSKKLQIA